MSACGDRPMRGGLWRKWPRGHDRPRKNMKTTLLSVYRFIKFRKFKHFSKLLPDAKFHAKFWTYPEVSGRYGNPTVFSLHLARHCENQTGSSNALDRHWTTTALNFFHFYKKVMQ